MLKQFFRTCDKIHWKLVLQRPKTFFLKVEKVEKKLKKSWKKVEKKKNVFRKFQNNDLKKNTYQVK